MVVLPTSLSQQLHPSQALGMCCRPDYHDERWEIPAVPPGRSAANPDQRLSHKLSLGERNDFVAVRNPDGHCQFFVDQGGEVSAPPFARGFARLAKFELAGLGGLGKANLASLLPK